MNTPWHSDPPVNYLGMRAGEGLSPGMGAPFMAIDPSSALGSASYADLYWPASFDFPPRPSPLSRLKDHFRHRVGLP